MKDILDLKDRKILYQLDLDCRKTDSQIGKRVGLSKQAVAYRIKNLVKKGYIERFASVIDHYKLGFSKFKVYFSLQNANKSTINNIIDFLKKHKKTEWIATCSGNWDIIAGYMVKDVYEFDKALKEFDEKFSKYILEKDITISLGVPHWRKEYLLDKKEKAPVIFQGGKNLELKIDKTDEEIIKIIVNNSRMSLVDMSGKLNLTPRVVKYRINKLKKKKIILMHRIFLNLSKFNWIFCKSVIKFKNLTEKRYNEFFNRLSSIKNLTYVINCIGSWDMELDFEIENFPKFNEIILDLKNEFSDIIKKDSFVIIMNEDKLDYYPGSYPKINKNN